MRFAQVPHLGVPVHRGMTHDGLGHYLSQVITKAPGPTADITGILRETRTDVVVNFLPVGSEMATKWYVEQILDAGCGFVNCIPVFIARESYWRRRFEERGLPVVGDDVKSQVGATIVHRVLTKLFMDRGVHLERTSQLNVGGNTDFYNMLERAAPRVQEDLQDRLGALPALPRACPTTTSTSGRATTSRGSPTASGPISAWRAGASAISPSTSSSSSRCGTRPTRRGW